ncbi:glycosyltransferase family protein [Acidomonas methanolica]|nr:hypothetical protein [Acidomonas methanolica]MBU2654542.1 hypothetical protein [Acidomonas methanolica]
MSDDGGGPSFSCAGGRNAGFPARSVMARMRAFGLRHPLALICALALALRLALLLFVPFVWRVDEIFQYAEPAHRLLTGDGVVTWEWRSGLRSWLLPGVIAGLMRLAFALGLGHSLLFAQGGLCLLSLGLVAAAWSFGRAAVGTRGAWICAMTMAVWPDPVIFASRTLTEAQGGLALDVGALLGATFLERRRLPSGLQALLIGLLLSLGMVIRLQFAPGTAVGLLFCLIAWRGSPAATIGLVLGAAIPVLGQGILDALTLGAPFRSVWTNFAINYLAHRADAYGVRSGGFYLGQMAAFWGAACLPVGLGCYWAFRTQLRPGRLLLAGVAAAILLSHSVIPHKEASFIYPALPLILVLAGTGLAQRWGGDVRLAAAILCSAGLVFVSGYWPHLHHRRGPYEASRMLYAHRDACGFGQYGPAFAQWSMTGGYTQLDRSAPFYYLTTPQQVAASERAFNYLLAQDVTLPSMPRDFAVLSCAQHFCVLRRPGLCDGQGVETLNALLRRTGE